MNIQELDRQYIAGTYARFPLQLVKGKGSLVWDETGREYIDLGGGIAVNTFGFADDAWAEAISAQAQILQHTSNLYYSAPCVRLAEQLCLRTGMKKVFFSNSGAEANECAIKVARQYAAQKKGPEHHGILTLSGSFHGRTLATLAATGQEVFHRHFQPLPEGFVSARTNDLEDVKRLLAKYKVAGILFEAVQGEGGVNPLDPEFVRGLADLAAQQDILLMADEVQIGNGRSGALYGYMNYGVQPDVVTTAKGLGGGLPIGATLLGEKAQDVLGPGMHGSTFGGNPVCCAGALNILSRIDETLLAGVRERSGYIMDALTGAPGIRSVTGMGLMLGIETEKDSGQVISACMDRGVLVIRAKEKVRLLPALNIPTDLLKKAVDIIKGVCAE